MSFSRTFLLATLSGLALTGCTTGETSNLPTELRLENLLQQRLSDEFTPDREIIVSYVEIPPNQTMEQHWHPGEEFHYYLEGEVTIALDEDTSIIGKPGQVGHVPYKKMHTAITGEQGVKILVFRVHTAGEPVRYLETGGSADK